MDAVWPMSWQQVAVIVWLAIDVVFGVIYHGEPKTGRYNAVSTIIGIGIFVTLLYTGGFWK